MRLLLAAACLSLLAACATQQAAPPEAVRQLAPSGKLRAAINYGNTVLAQRSPAGELSGVSVDLARELARRLGVPLELVPYDAAGKVNADATRNAWDVGFFAIDPKRGEEVAFTAPYVIIDHTSVDDALRGMGAGKKLVQAAVEWARAENQRLMPLCPFARSVFDKTPEYADVLVT